jgi:hypothetical protein
VHPADDGDPYLAISLTLEPAIVANLLADLSNLPEVTSIAPASRSRR